MALRRTKLLSIQSVTGIATVGIFTAGSTTTAAGVAGTTYVRSIVMHNTGISTATVSLYLNPNTNPVLTGYGITENRFLRVDLAENSTFFYETNYPMVLTSNDAISVDVIAPSDGSGVGLGSMINFIINGDTDI